MMTMLRILVWVTLWTALLLAQAPGPVPAGNEKPGKPATLVETSASALPAAPPTLPATPAGQTLASWLEMLNSRDKAYASYCTSCKPCEALLSKRRRFESFTPCALRGGSGPGSSYSHASLSLAG